MEWSDLATTNYLTKDHVGETGKNLTIERILREDISGKNKSEKEIKPVVYFEENVPPMIFNATNVKRLRHFFPDAAEQQDAQFQDCLPAGLLPTHAGQLESLREHRLAGCFRHAAADWQVQRVVAVVIHETRAAADVMVSPLELLSLLAAHLRSLRQRRCRVQHPARATGLQ